MGKEKSPCLGSVCKLDFGAFLDGASLDGASISKCAGKDPQCGEGGRLCCAYPHLTEPDQFASLFREKKGKPHGGVLWALGVNTIAAQWGIRRTTEGFFSNSWLPEKFWI